MSLSERIAHHLGWLYPHASSAELAVLAERVNDAFGPVTEPASSAETATPFRSDEVVLITYGDTFTSADQPHLRSLGEFWASHFATTFSTVHVLPFFISSSDGGFSIVDYRHVADGLGDWADLRAIGADELMVDLVCNHGSAQSEWFDEFVADREPGRGYYKTASLDDDLTAVVRPRTHPLLVPVETTAGTKHVWATFSPDQVDFDFANPDVLVEFCSILGFYASQGASRIRLDAIAYLWKQVGTPCVHLPQTHRVVKLMRTLLSANVPGRLLITETNVPHTQNVSYFGEPDLEQDGLVTDEAHLVYNFTLAPLIVWSVIAGRADTLTKWLGQLLPPPSGCAFLNFLATHDGIGLRPVEDLIAPDDLRPMIDRAVEVGGDFSAYSAPGGPRPYELNVSLADLLAGPNGETAARYVLAHALMFAVQGIPAMYVHSMLVSPGDTESVQRTGHKRDINRANIELTEAHARVTTGWRGTVFGQLSHLISLRRSHAVFGPTSPQTILDLDPSVVAVQRGVGAEAILAVHNLSADPVSLAVPDGFMARDVIADAPLVVTGATITLGPWQHSWMPRH